MHNLSNIDFYYFSGTGNTKLIADKMFDIFNGHNIKINLYIIIINDKYIRYLNFGLINKQFSFRLGKQVFIDIRN